jgi:CRISPR-associated protein Cmr2
MGDDLESAMVDLENRKLARNWQGVNWVGESSSLSGTDAIAWYGMDRENQDMKTLDWSEENRHIALFYRRLAFLLDGVNDPDGQPKDRQPEGKYIDGNERLNIPELTKRLITLPHIARSLGVELPEELRQRGFRDLIRRPQDNPASVGQKTGWFMGDGDKVGDYLKDLGSDQKIRDFSKIMRQWGQQFQRDFNQTELGRIIYAGGDDFLGIVYNSQFPDPQLDSIEIDRVFHWLQTLDQQWKTGKTEEINQRVTLSLGFVWAAHSIPQRDVLQHCREAEQRSKKLGRDRLTIRVLFNNGQYVQWTTKWKYLNTLNHYRDRDGGKNWGHIYSDFARLKARHAFGLGYLDNPRSHSDGADLEILDNLSTLLQFFDLYFSGYKEILEKEDNQIVSLPEGAPSKDYARAIVRWIDELIAIGWHLSIGETIKK